MSNDIRKVRPPRWETLGTALLVGCALFLTALTVSRELKPKGRNYRFVENQSDWRTYAQRGHLLRDKESAVTLVVFSDFQCPYCRRLVSVVDSLEAMGISSRMLFRHSPGPSHSHAIMAVRASECAARQDRFEQMHDALFANQDSIGRVPWIWFANQAWVTDSAAFVSCIREEGAIASLDADTIAANQLGVRGTPTVLIQDIRHNGLPSLDSLRAFIERKREGNAGP